jgi:hypothetical protein
MAGPEIVHPGIMNKRKIIIERNCLSTIIDLSILGAFLCYLFFIWKKYPYSIGGSLVFFTPICVIYYFSFVYKNFQVEFSLLSLIIFSLMVLNFIAYIEHTDGFSEVVLTGVFVCQITILLSVFRLMQKAFQIGKDVSLPKRALTIRIWRYLAGSFAITITFLLATATFFMAINSNGSMGNKILNLFNFPTWGLIWINIAFVLSLTRKRRSVDRAIKKLCVKKNVWTITSPVKKFVFISAALFLSGSVLETARGLWVVWFFSCLALSLSIVAVWRVWSCTLAGESPRVIVESEEEIIAQIPAIENPTYFLKFVCIATAIGLIYAILLFIVWAYWHK